MVLVLYSLLDEESSFQAEFIIVYSIINIALAVFYHFHLGLHKKFIKILSLRLHYFVTSLSICGIVAYFTDFQSISSVVYLALVYLLLLFVLDFVENCIV